MLSFYDWFAFFYCFTSNYHSPTNCYYISVVQVWISVNELLCLVFFFFMWLTFYDGCWITNKHFTVPILMQFDVIIVCNENLFIMKPKMNEKFANDSANFGCTFLQASCSLSLCFSISISLCLSLSFLELQKNTLPVDIYLHMIIFLSLHLESHSL